MRTALASLDPKETPSVFEVRGWLAAQPAALRTALMERSHPMTVARGQRVYAEGDGAGGIYGILSGGVGIELAAGRFLPKIAHIHRAGVWFGHGPILGGTTRTMGFVAVEDSRLVHVPLKALRDIRTADPDLATALGALANDGMNLACRAARELLIPDADRRIAAVLVRVTAADEAPFAGDGEGFVLSQSLLGEMSNASRHTVMRALHDFQERAWITTHYSRVQIVDARALSGFAWDEE